MSKLVNKILMEALDNKFNAFINSLKNSLPINNTEVREFNPDANSIGFKILKGSETILSIAYSRKQINGYNYISDALISKQYRGNGYYQLGLLKLNEYLKTIGSKGLCSMSIDPDTGIERSQKPSYVWDSLVRKGLAIKDENNNYFFKWKYNQFNSKEEIDKINSIKSPSEKEQAIEDYKNKIMAVLKQFNN